MNYELKKKLVEVEETRQQLYEVAKYKPITDPDVIRISQKLDRSIYEFYCFEKFIKMV